MIPAENYINFLEKVIYNHWIISLIIYILLVELYFLYAVKKYPFKGKNTETLFSTHSNKNDRIDTMFGYILINKLSCFSILSLIILFIILIPAFILTLIEEFNFEVFLFFSKLFLIPIIIYLFYKINEWIAKKYSKGKK